MIDDPILLNDWHAVLPLAQLEANSNVTGARLLGEDIVIWKAGDSVRAWKDLCVHRGTRLSLGEVLADDTLQCSYHGWTYDATGPVRANPGASRAETADQGAHFHLPCHCRLRHGLGLPGRTGLCHPAI